MLRSEKVLGPRKTSIPSCPCVPLISMRTLRRSVPLYAVSDVVYIETYRLEQVSMEAFVEGEIVGDVPWEEKDEETLLWVSV